MISFVESIADLSSFDIHKCKKQVTLMLLA